MLHNNRRWPATGTHIYSCIHNEMQCFCVTPIASAARHAFHDIITPKNVLHCVCDCARHNSRGAAACEPKQHQHHLIAIWAAYRAILGQGGSTPSPARAAGTNAVCVEMKAFTSNIFIFRHKTIPHCEGPMRIPSWNRTVSKPSLFCCWPTERGCLQTRATECTEGVEQVLP